MFPVWLVAFVAAVATATQTPVDLPAMLGLTVLATACAKRVKIQVKSGYTEPLNLFTVTALPPGNRKSAVFREMDLPLRDHERALASDARRAVAIALNQRTIDEKALEQLRRAAAKRADEQSQAARDEAEALATKLATTPIPSVPRLIVDDVTPERLATLMAENDGRIAVLSPEGGIFDLVGGRYSANRQANFDVILKGHAGDFLRVDRQGRSSPVILQDPALSIGLTVQPDVVAGLASVPGFRGRGLLGRFLYSLPRSRVGRREVDPPPVSSPVRDEYCEKVTALLRLVPAVDSAGDPIEHVLHLSDEARGHLTRFAAWLEPRLAGAGELAEVADWASKLVGAVARIAGLLHLADHAGDTSPWATPIPVATMARAEKVGRYLIPHALAAFREMGCDKGVDDARRVLDWAIGRGKSTFSKKQCFDAIRGRFATVQKLEPALGRLVEHNYIRAHVASDQKRPGRPGSPVYTLNPMALRQAVFDRVATHGAAVEGLDRGADAVPNAGDDVGREAEARGRTWPPSNRAGSSRFDPTHGTRPGRSRVTTTETMTISRSSPSDEP